MIIGEHESIWMWAEYGDALFWHQDGGCCGNCERFFTDRQHLTIEVSGIKGLKEWYQRFDDEKYPAYEWSEKEYTEWVAEGWRYAYQVRELLPDEIDMYYHHDTDGKPLVVHRANRVIPQKPMKSGERLLEEAFDLVWPHKDKVFPDPYLNFVVAMRTQCPYEELLEKAHCLWDDKTNKLIINWDMKDLICRVTFKIDRYYHGYEATAELRSRIALGDIRLEVDGCRQFGIDYHKPDGFKSLFDDLEWYILERGMK